MMKKCRFCAEEIQDAAVYCRYCHRRSTFNWPKAIIVAVVISSLVYVGVANQRQVRVIQRQVQELFREADGILRGIKNMLNDLAQGASAIKAYKESTSPVIVK